MTNHTWTPDRILRLRGLMKLSQVEFGLRLGVRQDTVSDWELGYTAPGREKQAVMAWLEDMAMKEAQS